MKQWMAAGIAALVAGSMVQEARAATADLSSPQASNPAAMGWMQGFPPAPGKTIRFTDPDYFAPPKLRWTVCHFRELMPTAGVDKGTAAAQALPVALDPGIDAVTFTPLGRSEPMTWRNAFDANYSDGVLVLHRGRIVYERYDGCLGPQTLHGAMSVTKSITGLLAEALVAEGRLDENARVGSLIPPLQASGFGDATVRQVMDMVTGIAFSEDYADPKAEVWAYSRAGSPVPPPPGAGAARSYFEYLQTVAKQGAHGEAFGYRTVNADVLGWLIARSTNKSVAQHLGDTLWSRIGAEREAFYTVDSLGTPFAGGGFNATLRDMARLGLLLASDGRWRGRQLIPAGVVGRIRAGGDKAAFARAGFVLLEGWSYRSMWWVSHDDHGAFAARGVHGQTLWIDPAAQMVIVRFASHPVAANAASDPTSLPAFRAVANYLMAQDAAANLQGGPWRIEQIGGVAVVADGDASVQFLPDGRLAGSASCNRLIGSYTRDGAALSIRLVGTTMMACPPALMQQEQALLKLLPEVSGYRIEGSGTLVLTTRDGRTVSARRQ